MSEWTVGTLKELIEARLEKSDMALTLQAREYERRLFELNGAHAQAMQQAATFLTIDKYESQRLSDQEARSLLADRYTARLESLERWRSRLTGMSVILGTGLVLLGGIITKLVFK